MSTEPILGNPSRVAATALLEAANLPTADLTDAHMASFFYCGSAASPFALAGVEFCGPYALLRSLVVEPGRRSEGLGAALVRHVEEFARQRGARSIFLLTTTAAGFFRHCGYADANRQNAPAEIRATREFSEICPQSSAFLVKQLGSVDIRPAAAVQPKMSSGKAQGEKFGHSK